MAKAISGGGPAIVTPDDPRSMADQYAEAVIEARRGGPREHAMVLKRGPVHGGPGPVCWD